MLLPRPGAEGRNRELAVRPLRASTGVELPSDALPTDWDAAGGGRVLLSSYTSGVYALHAGRGGGSVRVERLYAPPETGFMFGEARAGTTGIWAISLGRGLVHLEGPQAKLVGREGGLATNELLRVLVRNSGEVWVAHVPMLNARRGMVQILRGGAVVKTIELPSREEGTITDWVEIPERDSVFAATMAGIVELKSDGTHERLTTSPMTAIARGPRGVVGAVGGGVERWDGTRFQPVLFGLDDRRAPGRPLVAGAPMDVIIDPSGRWHILFGDGVLVTLSDKGTVRRLFTSTDGVPSSASRLIWNERGGYLIVAGDKGGPILAALMSLLGGQRRWFGVMAVTLTGAAAVGCGGRAKAGDAAVSMDSQDGPRDVGGEERGGDAAADVAMDMAMEAAADVATGAPDASSGSDATADRPPAEVGSDATADRAADAAEAGDGNPGDRPPTADATADACATPAGAPGERCGCGSCAGNARCVTTCTVGGGTTSVCAGAIADVGTCACGAFLDDRCTGGASCVCPRSCDDLGLCLTSAQKTTLCAGPLATGFSCS